VLYLSLAVSAALLGASRYLYPKRPGDPDR